MAIKYRMHKQVSAIKCNNRVIYTAQPILYSAMQTEEVLEAIEKKSALSKGDIRSTLISLSEVIFDAMESGRSVDLGELGHFRPTFRSKAVENPKDFDTRTHISQVKIVYLPSKQIKKRLSNIAFRKAKNK